jgi:hypothetical protein
VGFNALARTSRRKAGPSRARLRPRRRATNPLYARARAGDADSMHDSGDRIGVDIGGTFTDAVVAAPDGPLVVGKVSTTPPDFATGFFAAIDAAAGTLSLDTPSLLAHTRTLAHGTTVGINALVTGDVARASRWPVGGALLDPGRAARVASGRPRSSGDRTQAPVRERQLG